MDIETLSEIDNLTGATLGERRERLKVEIIKMNISELSEEFTKAEVIDVCEKETDLELGKEVIEQVLLDMEGVYVNHTGGEHYNKIKNPKSTSFEKISKPVWDEYKQFLDKYKSDGLSQFYEEKIRPAFYKFLKDFLVELTSSVKNLNGYDKKSIYTHHGSTDETLDKAIGSLNYDVPEENVFKQSVEEYLKEPEENLLKFIDDCYTTAVNKDLLERENEFMDFPDVPQRNRKLILDTNALVPLLADTDDLHTLVSTVCEKSSSEDVNFDLHYTPSTADELDGLIERSNNIQSGVSTSNKHKSSDNQFIEDYGNKMDLDWDDYVEELRNWREELRNREKYTITEVDFNHKPNEKIENETRRRLLDKSSPQVDYSKFEQFRHDWKLFGTVARHRQYSDWSFGPFVLTLDEKLAEIGMEVGEENEFSEIVGNQTLALHPQKLLNYLIAFSSVEFNSDDKEKFSMAVLQATSDFEEGLDIDEYIHRFAPKVDVDVDDEEELKELLLDHKLSNELKDAVEKNEDIRAEKISREIITDKDYLDRIEKSSDYKDRINFQESTIEELKEENARLREEGSTGGENESARIDESKFRTSYRECSTAFRTDLPVHIRETPFENPPNYQDEIEEIKHWLQNVTAKLNNYEKSHELSDDIELNIEELLADAIRLTT